MLWRPEETFRLEKEILGRIIRDIDSAGARRILVLCSAGGDVVLRIAEHLARKFEEEWSVTGLELDDRLLEESRAKAGERLYLDKISFLKSPKTKIPFEDGSFDAVVSEPTDIGQSQLPTSEERGLPCDKGVKFLVL